ncbi:MAG TPA: radical SAM protein [Planctomycetaceae bacterium]
MADLLLPQHADHPRTWRENKFVYPVVSRRSKGLSVGINLNPDKVCNFDCVYCQVDRRSDAETKFVETGRMLAELEATLRAVASGEIWDDDRFVKTPTHLRRLNDVAFSGDGEPTSHKNFPEVVAAVAAVKRSLAPAGTKLVLITNASLFHRPVVRRGLELLDENDGEVWAKLDAGTEGYYRLIERTPIPFRRILDNITEAAKARPLVIQSLFLRLDGTPPSAEEIAAYCDRLNEIAAAGGRIKLVQIYTVARRPAESAVSALSDAEVDGIADAVRDRTGLTVEAYYGR